MKKADLRKALNEYENLSNQIAALEEQKTALSEKTKRHMGDTEEMQIDDKIIRYKPVASSHFDAKAFQSAYTALYQQFCRATISRRFTVA